MPIPLIPILAAAGLYFLTRGNTAPDFVAIVAPEYRSERNDRMIRIIAGEFAAAGLGTNAIAAAITNAYAESGLNPTIPGDGGHSIGLFQLNDWGAGHGLTVAFRQDPVNNTRTILKREVLASRGKTFRDRAKAGAGVEELAAIFARDIERPADKAGAMASRSRLAATMWPTLAKTA
jgi:hypothetical protein